MEERWSDLARQLMWEMNPQTNYHGTPYTFNKFNDANFLTGEGAMAHGPGHYSADFFDTAKWYKHPSVDIFKGDTKVQDYVGHLRSFLERVQPHIDDIEYLEHEKKSLLRRLENAERSDVHMKKYKGIPTEGERLKLQLDALDNLDKYRVQYNQGNVYSVNVPNENFMWKEGLPLENQSEYVQRSIANRKPIDYTKYLSRNPEYAARILSELEDNKLGRLAKLFYEKSNYQNPSFNKKGFDLASRIINNLPINEQMKFLEYLDGKNYDTTQDMIKLYGDNVKGIRAVGNTDGPINVTFTGNNIKMANTPLQRFVNRIPTQTLGKMASKLYNTPGVKQTIKFADRVATPLMILEGMGLNQPVGQGSDIVPQYPENNTLYGYINNY